MADRSLSNITLQDAYSRAQVALEGGDSTRAVAITQHILRYYPQYIDAYRLLGEAYLDLGRSEEALRFFTHVLNADPQNVLAHIGRAIIAEDHHQVDIAIDEYERAFEVDPSITELRGELLRLYAIRYGSAGASIRTTPSGLAYVHLRAGLREAAISELGYVAQVRPDRWDVEVALAEALWRNEQLDECAAVAGDILAGHPACVKCKWLLGYLHWSTGRTESGRQYLMDAVALDPAYRIANTIWDATPWPVDRRITRAQTAMVPGWTQEELAGSDLDLSVALPPEPPAPSSESRRVTQKFETRPPLPGESQRITQKFETRPPLPGQTSELVPPPEAAAAESQEWAGILDSPDAPATFDLDWLDDWAAAAETAPAVETPPAVAPTASAYETLEFAAITSTGTEDTLPSAEGLIVTPAPEAAPPEPVAEATEPAAAPVEAANISGQGTTEIEAVPVALEESAPSADLVLPAAPVSEAALPAAEPDAFLAWLSEPVADMPEAPESAAEGSGEDMAEARVTGDSSPAAQVSMFPALVSEPPAAVAGVPLAEEDLTAAPAEEVSTAQASLFPAWLDEPANVAEQAARAENTTTDATVNAGEQAASAASAAADTTAQASEMDGAGTADGAEDSPPARHHAVHIFPAWLEEATSDDEDESDLEMLPAWMREAPPLEVDAPPAAASASPAADMPPTPPDAAILAAQVDESLPAPPVLAEAVSLVAAEQEAPASIAGEEPGVAVIEGQAEPPALSLEEPAVSATEAQGESLGAIAIPPTDDAPTPDAVVDFPDQSPLVGESALPIMESAPLEAGAAVPAEPDTIVTAERAEGEPAAALLPDDLFPAWLEEIERNEAASATAEPPAGADAAAMLSDEAAPAVATSPEATVSEAASASAIAPEVPADEAVPAITAPPQGIPAGEEIEATATVPEAMPAEEAADSAAPPTPPPATAAMSGADSVPGDQEGKAVESWAQPPAPAAEDGMFPAWMSETGAASLPVGATPGAPEAASAGPADSDQAASAHPESLTPAPEAGIFPARLETMPQPGSDAGAPAETAFTREAESAPLPGEASVLPDWLTEAVNVQSPESPAAAPPLALDEETLFATDHTLGGQAGDIPIDEDLFPAWLEEGPPAAPASGELSATVAAGASPQAPTTVADQAPSTAPAQEVNELPPVAVAEDVTFSAGSDEVVSSPAAAIAAAQSAHGMLGTAEAPATSQEPGTAENIAGERATPDTSEEPDEFPAWMAGPWFEVAVAPAAGTGEMSAESLVIVPDSAVQAPGTELPPALPVAADTSRQEGESGEDTAAPAMAATEGAAEPFAISAMAVPIPAVPGTPDAGTPEDAPDAAANAAARDTAGSATAGAAAAADSESAGLPGFIVADDSAPVESYPADATPEAAEPLHEEILDWPVPAEGSADAAAEADQPVDFSAVAEETTTAPPADLRAPESPTAPAAPPQDDASQAAESAPTPASQPALDHFAKVGYNHGDDSQIPHDAAESGPPPTPVGAAGAVTGPVEIPDRRSRVESGHLPDGSAEHGAPATAGQTAFATSEEDNMAPSYKEDDDQERQFDFDWDRDALPDYLKPFLMNETPGQPGQPPAPAAPAGPGANAAPPAGQPMPPAPPPGGGPGGNDFNLDNIQPFDFGAVPPPNRPAPPSGPVAPIRPLSAAPPPAPQQQAPGGFNESDFGGVQPFNFGAPAGAGGGDEFDFGSDALPSWLGSGGAAGPAFSFDTPAGVPQAADQTPGPDLSSPGIPDWLRTPETPTPQAAAPPPPAAPGGDFDFGGEALPSWLSASAAAPAPPAGNDFGDVQPFDFGAAGGQGQPQPFDFGAMAGGAAPQPFNFGAPAAPERGAAPPAGLGEDFDFSAVQPFDFGAQAPPAPSMPAGPGSGGDFDFGGIQPFDFGGTAAPAPGSSDVSGAAQAAGAPGEFDFSMVESFDFRGPGGATPAAGSSGDFDFGGVQPFDFGGGETTPATAGGPAMAGGPAGDFDFGGMQPFDFGGAPASDIAGDVSDVDDFIDFLSVGAGNAEPAPSTPGEFAFDLGGDVQPFSLEGAGLGSAPPAPGPAFGAPPAPMSGPPERGSRLPAGPGPEEMGSLAGDEFSFEPFMFDAEGGAAPAFSAPPANAPASKEAPPPFNQAPAMPTSPFNPGSMFAGRAQADVPPGLEDLPDLQPFSFEGLDSTSDQGYGYDTGDMGQSFGRRSTDRGETSRSGMAFNLDEESSGPAGDVHSFSWQRRTTPAREPAHAPEAPETAGSIFAKARKRKEELEQTLRQEAEARGEVYTPPPVVENLHPEEAAELRYWPNLDEEEAVASAPAQPAVQPFDFTTVAGPTPADVAQDMASLQLAPFEFEEEAAPTAGSPTIQLPEESAQVSAQVPDVPEFAAGQPMPGPVQDQTGLQAGTPAMPEPFAFDAESITADIQPFSFDLGETAPADAQPAQPLAEPFAFEPQQTGAASVQPFAFEPQESAADQSFAFEPQESGPAAVQPFSFEAQEGQPAVVEPFTFEAQETGAATAEPFAFEPQAGQPAAVQPFTFGAEEGQPSAVQPFTFDAEESGAAAVQPFAFEGQESAAPAVEPFAFEAQEEQPAAVQPFTFDTQESNTPAVEPFTFETPEAGAPAVEPFAFDASAMGEPAAEVAPFAFETPEATVEPEVEPFAFDMTEAGAAPAVEPFTFDMVESVAPPSFETAEPSATAPQAEAAPAETTAGELLWSIPVAEPGAAPVAEAGIEGGFGEEVAPGEYDFSGLQPFDLGALDLTPEERAYLTGEQAGAASMPSAEAPPTEVSAQAPAAPAEVPASAMEPAGIPELQLQHGEPAMGADVAEIEPFSFDVAAFEPPAAEPPAMDLGGVPPAQAPGYEAGAPTATVEPVEFDMGTISEAAPVEPFQFEFEPEAATSVPVEPFQFEPEAIEAETAQPFSFETPAPPAPTVTHYETSARSGTGPLAAETWAEIPAEGAFDFSGVEMDQTPAEPAEAAAPEAAAAQTPEALAAPVAAAPATEAPAEAPAEPAAPVVAEASTPVPVAEAPAPVAAEPAQAPVAPAAVPLAPAGGSMDELARHLRDNPDDTAGRLALAIGYEQRDDITRAAEQYRLLIKGRNVPENLLDIVTGNLRDLVEAQPDNPALHRLLGDAYMKQGQYQMAISQYNWLLTKGTR